MQASLLPSTSPCMLGINSEWRFRPSRYVAGDTLNIFPIDKNHVAFYLLDVSGHGVPAAMLSVTLSMLLTPDNLQGSPLKRFVTVSDTYVTVPPEQVIAELNRRFQSRDDQYFTMLYGLLDTQDLTLRISQAVADSKGKPDEGSRRRWFTGRNPAAGRIRRSKSS